MRIWYDNKVDEVTFAVGAESSEEAEFPVTNLQNSQRSPDLWRTTADGAIPAEYIVMNIGSANAVTSVIVLNHTLLAADTIKLEGNATDSWGAPSFTTTLTHASGVISKVFATQNYAYFRFAWTKNVAATAYDVGRLFVGDYHDTEKQPDYAGLSSTRRDRSTRMESRSGKVYTYDRYAESPRFWRLDFNAITETQKESFETILTEVGTHKPFFFQIDPSGSGEVAEVIYARFVKLPDFQVSGFDSELRRDVTLELEEHL